jgi:nucleotide-binding universal stress UspA family protein
VHHRRRPGGGPQLPTVRKGHALYSKILVGTDGSPTASEAVRQAVELARLHDAELVIIHGAKTTSAAPDLGFAGPSLDVEAIRTSGQEILEAAERAVGGGIRLRTAMRESDPADAILDEAEESGADLIVVGNRGMRGAKRFLLGSVPNRIAHHAPCSVLIVHTT